MVYLEMWFLCALCQQRTIYRSFRMISLRVVKKNECACAVQRAGGQGQGAPLASQRATASCSLGFV